MQTRERESAVAGHSVDASDMSPGTASTRPRRDELTYLADMIKELAAIADRLSCPTLVGIMNLAALEAQLERDRS